ncbi:MAG: beta-glucosidase [Bacteroidales bacterium]|nr:beta-glucosidase [Bacteroidales bacterium]
MKNTALIISGILLCTALPAQVVKLQADNIDDVVKAMTLEEKAAIVVGSAGDIAGNGSSIGLVPGAAGATQAIERLGIPSVVLADGPAGLRINPKRAGDEQTYYCTGFPVGSLLACSWNPDMVQKIGAAIGNETLEYGVDVLLAPGLNIHRNPLCGRNFEYYSEDPLLAGRTAAAYVRGVQSAGVGVSAKHFAVNSQETNRLLNDARVSRRALREIYLKGFEIVVKEAHPWTLMSSYNKINGTWSESNYDLLTRVLREDWGYDGMVMTDWTGTRVTSDQILAGNDLMEPGCKPQVEEIIAKVKSGELSEKALDACVARVLALVVKTPRFAGYGYSNKPDLLAHALLTREAAAEGMVLLKNDSNTLPFTDEVDKIALFGATSYDFIAGGTGSGNVNKPYVTSLDEGLVTFGFKLIPQISDYYRKYLSFEKLRQINESTGPGILLGEPAVTELRVNKGFAGKYAKEADAAVITIARQAGEGADRTLEGDFLLSEDERNMIINVCEAYHAEGKKVVVVLNVGGVIETESWKSYPDAILLAWAPGQEGGNTVAKVLGGEYFPSGKLSMTWPCDYFDHPSSSNFPYKRYDVVEESKGNLRNVGYTNYSEGLDVGYRYFCTSHKKVSYPFGYGLSYTTFQYIKPSVKVAANGTVTAGLYVYNTGRKSGKEVVQFYVAAPSGGLQKPAMELKAFAKTKCLAPGEFQYIEVKIDPYTLASYNEEACEWQLAPGTYTVNFGSSCEDLRAKGTFKVSKARSWKTSQAF